MQENYAMTQILTCQPPPGEPVASKSGKPQNTEEKAADCWRPANLDCLTDPELNDLEATCTLANLCIRVSEACTLLYTGIVSLCVVCNYCITEKQQLCSGYDAAITLEAVNHGIFQSECGINCIECQYRARCDKTNSDYFVEGGILPQPVSPFPFSISFHFTFHEYP